MHHHTRMVVASLVAAAVVGLAPRAHAQEGAYMMILLDTSGSMLYDPSGGLTHGDGSTRYPGRGTDDSRLFIAKEVIREAVSCAGGVRFGLARYRADFFPNFGIDDENFGNFCPFYDGNTTDDVDGLIRCPDFLYSDIDYISQAGWGDRTDNYECCRDLVDVFGTLVCGACTGADCHCYDFDGDGDCDHSDRSGFPIEVGRGADLLAAFDPAVPYDPNDILIWVDHEEVWSGTAYTNPEIRANGATPLARSMMDVYHHFRDDVGGGATPAPGVPGEAPCYRSAIILTDGGDSCEGSDGDARILDAAARLHDDENVETYIVAFTISEPAALATLDAAAAIGGTGYARRAESRDELRAAFAEIVEVATRVEVCNDVDDDCDGIIDDIFRPCSTACGGGQEQCLGGSWGACSARTPSTEVCDGVDNDCDGATDEGLGGATCGTNVGECTFGLEECRGRAVVCVGGVQPVTEVCDGLDNDCDGATDESDPIVDAPTTCGVDVGVCHSGAFECVAGELQCSGGAASAEVCDGLDNDCDGEADEDLVRPCGLAGCPGIEECVGGSWGVCTAPAAEEEVCDGIDNDCDGLVDESDPVVGSACGSDVGECVAGAWVCSGGVLLCEGSTEPTEEICDGVDNDCDGSADEGLPLGEACDVGSGHGDMGQCEFGHYTCVDGDLSCEGVVGPSDEVCDCVDNDCDGATDEGIAGDVCGTDVGECQTGIVACTACSQVCDGEIGPMPETCDCRDNDCDGVVDNDDGSLCPDGTSCVECQCALPCGTGEFPCPAGRQCVDGFCVGDLCSGVVCGDCEDCNPSTGECVDRCEGRTCDPGMVCYCGTCVVESCYHLGCPPGQVCLDDECQEHPCEGVSCLHGDFCRDGECVDMCTAEIVCERDEHCVDGECVDDLCWDATCDPGEMCVPETGECSGECRDVTCPPGQVCDPSTGACVDDPCSAVTCPSYGTCVEGVCVSYEELPPVCVPEATPGGCACAAAPTGEGPPGWPGWLVVFAAVVALFRGMRRTGGAR